MRITGGKARGIPLKAPPGKSTRPATDKTREAVFSSLGPFVEEARVLDLFAGTGSYGLEALSRGAASATFVEMNRKLGGILKQNIAAVCKSAGLPEEVASVQTGDALRAEVGTNGVYDLIFIDPPYELIDQEWGTIIMRLNNLLTQDGVVVFEMPAHLDLKADGWEEYRRLGKKTGHNEPSIRFLRKV